MLKFLLLVLVSGLAWAADDHATMSLQRFNDKLVVTVNHDKGWHTYWKNPGDSGLPSKFKFSLNGKPVELKAYEWPLPEKHLEAGDILTIGYENKQHFFFDDQAGVIEAKIEVLICADICIPGEALLKLEKDQKFVSNRQVQPYSESELKNAFTELPSDGSLPIGLEYHVTRTKDQNLLTLHYSLKGLKNFKLPHKLNFLTGFPLPPFGYKRETLFKQGDTLYGKLEIEWDGEYQDPPLPLAIDGQFQKTYELPFLLNAPGSSQVQKIVLKVKDFAASTSGLDDFYKKLPFFDDKAKTAEVETSMISYIEYLFFAFLGGLILNLMPCVLPVISLKLFGLIKHQDTPRKKLLSHNLSYTAGVLSTLMALGLVIVGLKMTGEEVGWGFQLQSPAFILIMMIVLFILSLNLFGLFEFITPGGSKLGNAQIEEGFSGDFFSGVLTTILSTPCSAPFLGTALTFAFTTSNSTIFLMFIFIGLGLSFPFLLTAIFPKSLAIFPRPGAWMEKLKYFLGLSLVATIVWLYDVFVSLVNYEAISWKLNLLFALWFFAFFFAQKISRNKVLLVLIFALPLCLTTLAINDLEARSADKVVNTKSDWLPWSEAKLEETKGKLVFMDFTAEWCLTCKVNKKLVLETESFEELKKKYELVTMRADWTKRDDNITQFLKKYKAISVPAYFVQKKDGTIAFLGETISLGKIEESLQ